MYRKFKINKILIVFLSSAILGSAGVFLDWKLTSSEVLPLIPDGQLSDAKSKALELIITRSTLIANWNIASIGAALFAFIQLGRPNSTKLSDLLILGSAITAVSSVFFSQVLLDIASRTLLLEQDIFFSKNLFLTLNSQYVLTLISVFSLAVGGFIMEKK